MNASISVMKSSRFVCKHRPQACFVLKTHKAGMCEGQPFYIEISRCRDCGKQFSRRIES